MYFKCSWEGILLRLGVSICLDMVSISTSSKSESRQSRKSRQRQKVSLDNRDISIEIDTSRFRLDNNVQTKKSRLRNSSRSEIFGVSRQFVSISTKKCVDFCIISRLRLDKSRKSQRVLTNLYNLEESRQSRQKSQRVKVSTEKSWF